MVAAPLVSVLMPTHSRLDTIGFAIQSVLDQTVTDFELLVVGDGCAAGTAEVVASFADPRIRFFDFPKAPNVGYANRNRALLESKGRYVAFAPDDDLWFPDHLQRLLELLQAGAPLAYSQALWVSTDGIAAPFLMNLEFADELGLFNDNINSIAAGCVIYRADSLPHRAVWPEDLPVSGDWRLWQRILRENPGTPPAYCRLPTVLHFSARRKNSRHAGSGQFATLISIADAVDWWPSPLKVRIPPGATEQSVFAGAMRADPGGWSGTIRGAALDLAYRLAWDDITYVRPALALAHAEVANLLRREKDSTPVSDKGIASRVRDWLRRF